MNRTLTNVLFGGIGSNVQQSDYKIEGSITKTSVEETADALSNADNVILVSHDSAASLIKFPDRSTRSLGTVWLWQKHNMRLRKSLVFCDPVISTSALLSTLLLDGESAPSMTTINRVLTEKYAVCRVNVTYYSLRLLFRTIVRPLLCLAFNLVTDKAGSCA